MLHRIEPLHFPTRGARPALYKLLQKSECFVWTSEAQEALGGLKALLSKAPVLVPPTSEGTLVLYITATTQVMSTFLVVEKEEEGHTLKVQHPIYFVREILADTKTHYPQIQKLLYVVLIAKCKLRHYFESHPVMVVTSFPLGEIVRNPNVTGRIAIELMGQGIMFSSLTAIKSQALTDFVSEWMETQLPPAPVD